MKLFTSTHYFDYPWGQVTAANWQKYPNESSAHVVAVDIIRREYIPEKDVLLTERLITCEQGIPSWLKYIVGNKSTSYVREVSTVDRKNQTLTMRSVNMTMNNLLNVYETVVYSPDPENPSRTKFEQSAEITAYASFKKICDRIEDWSVERFGQNAIKGKIGFEGVLKVLDDKWKESSKLIDDVTDKTSAVFSEVSNEVSGKFIVVKNEVEEKTSEVLQEVEKHLSLKDKFLGKFTKG